MEEFNARYTPEQWADHYQKTYLDTLTLDAATRIIKNDMTNMARTCVSIGFHLKAVRDRELFRESGYETIWDYAADQFGLSMSSASRYMTINDMFSVGGNTPQLQDEYRNFSKSQLQEMITMPDEQRQLVTEDMTVKEIRQIKNPKPEQVEESNHEEEQIPGQMDIQDFTDVLPEESVATSQKLDENSSCPPGISQCIRQEWGSSEEQQETGRKECKKCWNQWKKTQKYVDKSEDKGEQVSVYGLPARTYPPESLIAIAGCGTHDCFNCHIDGCQIRQEDCRCVEAPCGNPFPCTTLNVVENIRDDIGDSCQFVNHDLADHRVGDHEPVPCCKRCDDPCGYECRKSVESRAKVEQDHLTGQGEDTDIEAEKAVEVTEELCEEYSHLKTDYELLKAELNKAQRLLNDMLECCAPEDELVRRQKILVGALAAMKCDLVENPPEEPEQPEFPVLKNNDQRQEWVKNYKAWGLWYRDEHIDVNYYKFDFEDGTRLIAAEYPQRELYWSRERRDEVHYHLLEKNALKYRMDNNDRYDKQYCQQTSSMTEITDYLKRIRKGVRP